MNQDTKNEQSIELYRKIIKQNVAASDLIQKLHFLKKILEPIIDDIINTAVRKAHNMKVIEGGNGLQNKSTKPMIEFSSITDTSSQQLSRLPPKPDSRMAGHDLTPIVEARESTDDDTMLMKDATLEGDSEQKEISSSEPRTSSTSGSVVLVGKPEVIHDLPGDRDSTELQEQTPSKTPSEIRSEKAKIAARRKTPFPSHLILEAEEALENPDDIIPTKDAPKKKKLPSSRTSRKKDASNISKDVRDLTDQLLSPLKTRVRTNPAVVEEMVTLLHKLSKSMDSVIADNPELQKFSSVDQSDVVVHRCIPVEFHKTKEIPHSSQYHRSLKKPKRTLEKQKPELDQERRNKHL